MGNSCVLRLGHVVFDEITFQREGFKADSDLNLEFSFNFEPEEGGNFIARVRVVGNKANEYRFVVQASGYFNTIESSEDGQMIMYQNAVAIIFPYIRSQITLLTAQPGIDPVVLQPFNIAQMVEYAMKKAK